MELFSQPLLTDRLLLRPYQDGDARAMYKNWCHDPEVTRFLTWEPHPNLQATKAYLDYRLAYQQAPRHYGWIIVRGTTPIGAIDLVSEQPDNGFELGYCLSKAYWGQGLMSEAFHAVLSFMFYRADYAYCLMRAEMANIGSRKVIEKQGFVLEKENEPFFEEKKNKTVMLALYRLNKEDFIA